MSRVPYYRQIADTLRTRIVDGVYAVDDCLPASIELEKTFNVSNITIRKALNLLKEEGWIDTRRGIGTIVKRGANCKIVDIKISGKFTEWLDWTSGKKHNIEQTVLGIDHERGPAQIREELNIPKNEPAWRMRRLRSIKNEPISYHINYAGLELDGLVKQKDLQGSGSFIELMQKRYPKKIIRIDQHVEATVANMDLAKILKVEFGAPIFFVQHLYVSEEEKIVVVAHLFMRADRYRYSTSIKPEGGDA